MSERTRATVKDFVPPMLILLYSVGFLSWSYTYDARAQQVPVLVGWSLVALCILDLIAVSGTRLGDAVKAFFSGTIVGEGEVSADAYTTGKTIIAILWPVGFVVLVFFFGFIATIPVYVFLFVAIQGKRGVRQAAWASIATTAFTYIVFEQLLRYQVYEGLLFGG